MQDWKDRRILIIGAARQGLALARFLARQGAQVTLNDKRTPEQMQPAMQSLADLPVRWALGEHALELLDQTDMLCLSGGVPLTLPIVIEAQRRGIPLSNDSEIFIQSVPCRVLGITGSAGKTTTTTLVGRMAQAAIQPPQKSWVGGNIGLPLIEYLGEISADDLVILELSSFQLEQMTRSPQLAAILNITPNHLDRHGTLEAYTAAKARLIEFQNAQDCAVLCREDPGSWALAGKVRGRLVSFGLKRQTDDSPGTYFEDGRLYLWDGSRAQEILLRTDILLRGEHNVMNVLAACAIAYAAGFPVSAMRSGVEGFCGVPHRLEFVREYKGSRWYNGSIATAPERTIADIQAFDEPLVLLLGGRDKKLPWERLAKLAHERVDHIILFGEAAEKIRAALEAEPGNGRRCTIKSCAGMAEAVQAAAGLVEAGDVVLLSPGGTSYDEFKDFEERGDRFREWVKAL